MWYWVILAKVDGIVFLVVIVLVYVSMVMGYGCEVFGWVCDVVVFE